MEITNLGQARWQLKTKTGQLVMGNDKKLSVAKDGDEIVISGPGEYEAKGFSITGFQNGSYLIEVEDIRLGYLTEKEEVDVLLTDSWSIAKEVQPSTLIPVSAEAQIAIVKASGLEAKREKKLVVSKLSLPEETELIILGEK